jgi:hypothetical protein
MHFFFGLLIFLYFVLRSSTHWGRRRVSRHDLYNGAARTFEDLVSQYGGNAYRAGWRKLIYVTQDRAVEIQVHSDSRRLVLRLRKSFPMRFSFYRLPRLIYAFLDAFLEPKMKVEGTHYLVGARDSQMLAGLRDRVGFVALMQKLDQAGFSGQIGQYGMKLWKRISTEDLNDLRMMNFVRLAQDLVHLCDPELINIPVQPLSSEKRCAYCKEDLSEIDSVQYCQFCGTPHHKECFELNGKCTVFGCEQPAPPQPQLVDSPQSTLT